MKSRLLQSKQSSSVNLPIPSHTSGPWPVIISDCYESNKDKPLLVFLVFEYMY